MRKNIFLSASMYISALLLSLVNVALIWIVVMYPVAATQGSIHPYFHFLTGIFVFSIIIFWALYGSNKVSEVVYRSCRLGAILSLLIPVIAGMMSIFWTVGAVDRPSGFFTNFSSLEIPVYASGIAILMIIIFIGSSYIAEAKMKDSPQ